MKTERCTVIKEDDGRLKAIPCGQTISRIYFWGSQEINGWDFDQMTFVYGMQAITLGINEFLFAGTWAVGGYIKEGSLDRLLLRPVGTMFSILSADVTLHGLGSAALGLALCIISLRRLHTVVTIGLILYWILAIVCGALIYFSINMICATTAFWITDSSSVMMLVQNVSEFSKYPVSIYKKWLQIFLSFMIPFAFTSTFPCDDPVQRSGRGDRPDSSPFGKVSAGRCGDQRGPDR